MNFNPFNLISKAVIKMNINAQMPKEAAAQAGLILAWCAGLALLILSVSIGAGLILWLL